MYDANSVKGPCSESSSLYDYLEDYAETESKKENVEIFQQNLRKKLEADRPRHNLCPKLVNFVTELITKIQNGQAPEQVTRYKSTQYSLSHSVTYSPNSKMIYIDLKKLCVQGLFPKLRRGVRIDPNLLILDSFIAKKVPASARDKKINLFEQSIRENELAKQLDHQNLFQPCDSYQYRSRRGEEKLWVANERPLFSGTQMSAMDPKPTLGDFLKVFIGVAKGLDHIHKQEMIHQNVTPEYILIYKDYVAKLTNFSAVCFEGECQENHSSSPYHPLELRQNEGIYSKKDDVYSFGISMMVMVYGGQYVFDQLELKNHFENMPSSNPERILRDIMVEATAEKRADRPPLSNIIERLKDLQFRMYQAEESKKVSQVTK